ncbi:MAG: hypothetical protein KJ697_03955, partial [Nanoarchaeota archaeon]|nr:hypothetical protein [Nanoarchaeota archaeon]MBU4124306.1 hypothetical protein [Nanoarchaeota archaeon]
MGIKSYIFRILAQKKEKKGDFYNAGLLYDKAKMPLKVSEMAYDLQVRPNEPGPWDESTRARIKKEDEERNIKAGHLADLAGSYGVDSHKIMKTRIGQLKNTMKTHGVIDAGYETSHENKKNTKKVTAVSILALFGMYLLSLQGSVTAGYAMCLDNGNVLIGGIALIVIILLFVLINTRK